MRSIYFQNLTAFLCITSSLIVIGSDRPKTKDILSGDRVIQPTTKPLWSGKPADELEAQMHFYMRPTARKVAQRKRQFMF